MPAAGFLRRQVVRNPQMTAKDLAIILVVTIILLLLPLYILSVTYDQNKIGFVIEQN